MIGHWVIAYTIAFIGMAACQIFGLLALSAFAQTMSTAAKELATALVLTLSFGAGFGSAALFLSRCFKANGLSMVDSMAINLKSMEGSFGRALGMACLGLAGVIFLNWLVSLLPLPAPDSPAGNMAVKFSGLAFLVFAFSALVFAPIFEEILFRGYLMSACRVGFSQGRVFRLLGNNSRVADWAAIVVSSAIFAAAHMTLTGFPPLFATGLVLAVLYKKSGSLIPSMLLHFLVNSLAFTALYMQTLGH